MISILYRFTTKTPLKNMFRLILFCELLNDCAILCYRYRIHTEMNEDLLGYILKQVKTFFGND
ncbi:MAG: hypothetical protein M3367_06540 [Acidobacteriota bacterium]|nr:hypothetical protein [Acidobacteriota bacterium]